MAQDEDSKNQDRPEAKTLEGEWREHEEDQANDDVELTLPEVDKRPKRRSWGFLLGLVVLLIVIAAVGAAGYFGWNASQSLLDQQAQSRQQQGKLQSQIQNLESQLNTLQKAQSTASSGRISQLKQLSESNEKQARLQQDNADAINALQSSMAEWAARSGASQTGWQLAEAEWLLWLANMRLQLQDEYRGAIAALTQADQLLQQLDHPLLRAVRAKLSEEKLLLKTAERPDIDNIALSLLAMSNQAEQLPLPARPKPRGEIQEAGNERPEQAQGWRAVAQGLWQEMRSLVVVRRQEKNLRPWLSDREEQLIYQGLQVRLDAARLAALRGKGSLYQQSIRSAQTWLLSWFDSNSDTVNAVDAELDALAKQHLEHQHPDISQSLSLLRELRQAGLE